MVRPIHHIRAGRKYGFPLCCVLRFSFGYGYQAEKRGVHYARDGSTYWVPCRLFHQTHRTRQESTLANAFRCAPMMARLSDVLAREPKLHIRDGRLYYKIGAADWEPLG